MIKDIITKILVWEAKVALARHTPKIIGITGSSGKSSTKDAIAVVLEKKFRIRKSIKSYNSELGLALAVLGLQTAWSNPLGWIKNITEGFKEIWRKDAPKILVLEMGVDRPKDLEKLLKIARPDIGVVTAIGEVPVHVEFFAGPEEVAKEKAKLVRALSAQGHAVLNFDDEVVWGMRKEIKANVISYGFGKGAKILASNINISIEKGISFKLNYEGNSLPVRLKNVFGKHHIYAALSAAAVGIIYEMNLIEIVEALSLYKPPPGRLRLIGGIKNSLILDDSYNASPLATHAALDTLAELAVPSEALAKEGRKIVVFGDMLEIGKFTIVAHKAVGEKAAKIADMFIAVGPRAKFAVEGAIFAGMDKSRVFNFSTSREAAAFLKEKITEGDLILIKGSQAMRMERVVLEIMSEPNLASELLCRQDDYWKNKE